MEDLLTGTQTPVEPKNFLTELVGPDRKFKDVDSLARGKWESDSYIKVLERQLDEFRTDYLKLQEDNTKRATLEELVHQIRQPTSTNQPIEKVVEPKPYKPDPDEIQSLIDTRLDQRDQARKEADNYNLVKNKIVERFGNDYQDKLRQRAQELDMSVEEINQLARQSPKMLLEALGIGRLDFQANNLNVPRSQNTFKPNPPEKRTWSWYQKLKQSNPVEYRLAKTNVQMHNDMMSLGEEFMDGDYYTSGLHERTDVPTTPSTTHFR